MTYVRMYWTVYLNFRLKNDDLLSLSTLRFSEWLNRHRNIYLTYVVRMRDTLGR